MFNSRLKYQAAFGVLFAFSAAALYGQVMDVKIIKRQTGDTAYDFTTAGHTDTSVRTHVKCKEGTYGEHCVKITDRDKEYVPRTQGTYSVTGATLSLLLPDGRVAVVNCASKLNLFSTDPHPQRSCRIPPGDNIQAEFKGNNAKLLWSVSVDGSKMESETYKILAINDK
jgi:hypothetical protein